MKKLYSFKCLCLIALMSLIYGTAHASHIYGMELTYKYKTANVYTIMLTAYVDCSGSASLVASMATASPRITVYDGNTFKDTIRLIEDNNVSNIEVLACPQDANIGTKCNGGTLPGMKRYIYSKDYVVATASTKWRFVFDGDMLNSNAGRSGTITNINAAASANLVTLEAKLNNDGVNNNSVDYNVVSQYYCLNTLSYYDISAQEQDGDSLYYLLVSANDANGAPIQYVSPYTYQHPMHASFFSSGNLNGLISFNPDQQQNTLMVFEVQEYRNGVFVGSSQKENVFSIISGCTNFPPCIATTAVKEVSKAVQVNVYPNPAKDEVNIESPEMIKEVELYNEIGQKVFSKELSDKHFSISLKQAQLPNGVYSVAVYTEHGVVKQNVSVLR